MGAEGIGGTDQENILICDTVDEFIKTLIFCFKEKEKAKQIGLNAQEFVNHFYQKKKIYANVVLKLNTLINE